MCELDSLTLIEQAYDKFGAGVLCLLFPELFKEEDVDFINLPNEEIEK